MRCLQWSKADTWRLELPTHSRSYLDYIEVRRPLIVHAGKRGVTHGSSKVDLTLLHRCRAIGGSHRILAELSVIKTVNIHRHILIKKDSSGKPPISCRTIVGHRVGAPNRREAGTELDLAVVLQRVRVDIGNWGLFPRLHQRIEGDRARDQCSNLSGVQLGVEAKAQHAAGLPSDHCRTAKRSTV